MMLSLPFEKSSCLILYCIDMYNSQNSADIKKIEINMQLNKPCTVFHKSYCIFNSCSSNSKRNILRKSPNTAQGFKSRIISCLIWSRSCSFAFRLVFCCPTDQLSSSLFECAIKNIKRKNTFKFLLGNLKRYHSASTTKIVGILVRILQDIKEIKTNRV